MSSKIYDVVHGNGTYKAADGSEKTRWQNVGAVFKSDKGNISMKLDSIPTRRNEQGELWINLFVPQDREAKPVQTASEPAPTSYGFRENPPPPTDEDVPF